MNTLKKETVLISPSQMFDMIESFAGTVLGYMRACKSQHIDECTMMTLSERVLEECKESGLEGRIIIITLLETACALYRTSCDGTPVNEEFRECPREHLN